MKTFQSMAIGGCIVAVAVIGLQALPDVQWVVVIAAGILGLVALVTLAIDAFMPHPAPQPVAQPVSQPAWDPREPAVLVAQPVAESWSQPAQPAQPVADRWTQPLAQPVAVDLQPVATAAQPLCSPYEVISDRIFKDATAERISPWLVQPPPPIPVDDDPDELPDTPEPALPLPRRAPTAAEYPLVWDAIQDAGSMNAAILAVYGSKDGKTHRWVSRVAEFYRNGHPMVDELGHESAVFCHELAGTCDMPGLVAARLGLELDDNALQEMTAWFDRCQECDSWYLITGPCPCQQGEQEVA